MTTFMQKVNLQRALEGELTKTINQMQEVKQSRVHLVIPEKRLFEEPKIEYSIRSINSLIKSINHCQNELLELKVKTVIIDDNSKIENLNKIKNLTENNNIELISLNHDKYKPAIKQQKSNQTFSNLASLLQSFEFGKDNGEDLIFFVEDDYLHTKTMLKEIILSFERISSQLNKDIFMCPSDYHYR